MHRSAGHNGGAETPVAFFRNDDVNELSPELIRLSEVFFEAQIPIIHAVEPGNVTDECVEWLLAMKKKHGRLLEIMQHGYNHVKHNSGEFGGKRSFKEQYDDLQRGMAIMDDRFGDNWFRAVNFPYGPYNQATIRAVDTLGFVVFNGHYNPRFSRRLFYAIGQLLGKGQIFRRHVSHHLRTYPDTNTFTIDMAIIYNSDFYGHYGSHDCEWEELNDLMALFNAAQQQINVIGWLLHHRYHQETESLDLVRQTIQGMKARVPDIEFWNFEEIYQVYAKGLPPAAVVTGSSAKPEATGEGPRRP